MLRRISPVAMSSIRYSTSSLAKKSAALRAAACMPWPNAFPYCSATLEEIARASHRCAAPARAGAGPSASAAAYVKRRKRASELIRLADPLPHGADDMHHLPVGDPLATRSLALLALRSSNGALHRALDPLRRADRNIGLHPTLPESVAAAASPAC